MEGFTKGQVTNNVEGQPVESADYVYGPIVAGVIFKIANDKVSVGT